MEAKSGTDADIVVEAVQEFIDHLHDDLPVGPASELGVDEPKGLKVRSELETQRLAVIGKNIVDNQIGMKTA